METHKQRNFRFFIGTVVMLYFSFASVCATSAKADSRKPNVIFLMADDLGYVDAGLNGNEIIKTPYLDIMAKEGIRFTRFYSIGPV